MHDTPRKLRPPLRKILLLKTIHTRHGRGYELICKWLFVTGWGDEPSTGDGLTLLFCVVVYGVETVVG